MASILTLIGIITVVAAVVRLGRFIYHYTVPSTIRRYLDGPNTWALVTGASDGIGLGFAHELAHIGFNVIIHGRNAAKLDKIRAELESHYPDRKFRTLVLDAGRIALDDIQKIDYPNLAVLVNNVGSGDGDRTWMPFMSRSLDEVAAMMSTNATFASVLTRQVLPQLRRPGLVINVGSVLDSWSSAYVEPYCGAKGHNRSFSDALRMEMRMEGHDIEVMHLRVLTVATKTSREQASLMTVLPRTMARAALDRVGNGAASTVGCLRHAVVVGLVELLMPRQLISIGVSRAVAQKIYRPE